MRRTIIGGLVPLALALSACGGSPADPSADRPSVAATPATAGDSAGASAPTGSTDGGGGTSGGGDLCGALTMDEVSEATGVEVTSTTPADLQGVLSCNYNDASGAPVAGTTLATSAGGVGAVDMFNANEAEGQPVSGIGDRAVMTGDDNFPILMVLVDDRLYSLSVLADTLDAAGKWAATEELARLSVDRLP
jgi:hypothetical protein